jgi:hypothetical protein
MANARTGSVPAHSLFDGPANEFSCVDIDENETDSRSLIHVPSSVCSASGTPGR